MSDDKDQVKTLFERAASKTAEKLSPEEKLRNELNKETKRHTEDLIDAVRAAQVLSERSGGPRTITMADMLKAMKEAHRERENNINHKPSASTIEAISLYLKETHSPSAAQRLQDIIPNLGESPFKPTVPPGL